MEVIYQLNKGLEDGPYAKPFVGLGVTGSFWNREIKAMEKVPYTVVEVRTAQKIIVQCDNDATKVYTITLRCDGIWATFKADRLEGCSMYWFVGRRDR